MSIGRSSTHQWEEVLLDSLKDLPFLVKEVANPWATVEEDTVETRQAPVAEQRFIHLILQMTSLHKAYHQTPEASVEEWNGVLKAHLKQLTVQPQTLVEVPTI